MQTATCLHLITAERSEPTRRPAGEVAVLLQTTSGQWFDRIGVLSVGPADCLGDLDGSGIVDAQDLALLLAAWNSTPSDPAWNPDADLDGSGQIDAQDLATLLSQSLVKCD